MSARWRDGSDSGLTLVEVLLAVSILGVGVLVLVGGMMTSIKVSGQGRVAAEGQAGLRAYAESVSSAAYVDCAGSYASPGFTPPSGWVASAPAVTYWNGSSFANGCGPDLGLQRVALTLTASDGSVESLTIAKRAP